MKKIILALLFMSLISCQKESKNQVKAKNVSTPTLEINKNVVASHEISADTVFFYKDEKPLVNEFVLIHLLQKKYDKDSICDAFFKLDFVKNKALIYTQKIQVKGYDNESDWYGNIEFDAVSSPLRTVTVGYGACGYMQHSYLFYLDEKKPDLVHQWESMSDSGWGTWGQILSGSPTNFYFRTESFSPKEDTEDEEMGIAEYSDSIRFELKNNKWRKTFQTQKEIIYRKKEINFNAFHHVNE